MDDQQAAKYVQEQMNVIAEAINKVVAAICQQCAAKIGVPSATPMLPITEKALNEMVEKLVGDAINDADIDSMIDDKVSDATSDFLDDSGVEDKINDAMGDYITESDVDDKLSDYAETDYVDDRVDEVVSEKLAEFKAELLNYNKAKLAEIFNKMQQSIHDISV